MPGIGASLLKHALTWSTTAFATTLTRSEPETEKGDDVDLKAKHINWHTLRLAQPTLVGIPPPGFQ